MKKLQTTSKKLHTSWPAKAGAVGTAFLLMLGTATFAQETQGQQQETQEQQQDTQQQERENVSNTNVDDFGQWDGNADQQWDREEYNSSMRESGFYGNWQNEQGEFTQNEFNQGIFRSWDTDGDGYINNDEYTSGNSAFETDYGNNFGAWDLNGDGQLDPEEYNSGMNEAGIYGGWDADADGQLNEDEFNDGVFNSWDADRDGNLSSDEYNNANREAWSGSATRPEAQTGEDIDNSGIETETQLEGEGTETESETEVDTDTDTDTGYDSPEAGDDFGNDTDVDSDTGDDNSGIDDGSEK